MQFILLNPRDTSIPDNQHHWSIYVAVTINYDVINGKLFTVFDHHSTANKMDLK